MLLSEQTKIHIHQYPFAETLNPILHKIIMDRADREDMGAIMTDYESFEVPEFEKIGNYALNLIRGWEWSLDTPVRRNDPLTLYNIWGQWYRKGDFQIAHTHYPNQWSFVYFVNTPRGSSPLVFSRSKKKVAAKAGNMVIFPAWVRHQVPPNKCQERSVVAGNFYYKNRSTPQYRSNSVYDAF